MPITRLTLAVAVAVVVVGGMRTDVTAAPLRPKSGTPLGFEPVPHTPPSPLTLSDGRLSAVVNASGGGGFGSLLSLGATSGGNVLKAGPARAAVWSATFVGAGGASTTLSALTAQCAGTTVAHGATATRATLQWSQCTAAFGGAVGGKAAAGNATWVEHKGANCAGECLHTDSKGPNGGHCDRMPGCGHDAHLPDCDPTAMKARCEGAPTCTAFNTNGYLYAGGGVVPFTAYPLSCFTDTPPPPPPPPPATIGVTLEYIVQGGELQLWVAFTGDGAVALWDYTVAVAAVEVTPSTAAVSNQAAKQLTGLYDTAAPVGTAPAVYFAAHDPRHVVKTCGASVSTGVLQCNVLALNGTQPLHKYTAAFAIVTTVTTGDWWDLASIYRAWVLPNSEWTSPGPLALRTDLPDWLENITLWMNNNWGGDPLRPNYGGDPEYVKNEMLKVNGVLGLPEHGGHLALHWYEWDTLGYKLGSNHTKCDRVGAPCGFDTHYPDYFPARVGCKESIQAMHDAGMRVIPYINGQLFDTLIPRYSTDKAVAAVQQFVEQPAMAVDATHPVPTNPHLEHFDGITSAVMCPATDYWHGVMRDTVLEIVNDLGFDGAYVDQVGNGETRNCAAPHHNHTINGGSFWAEAFYSIMGEVRAGVPPGTTMYMTEGTVEEVSGRGFDILLGLEWTGLPLWHAIYGGYGYATGLAGSISAPLAGGLCTELTKQFMVGGTMGWFTYQNYHDQFYDPANAVFVSYIRRLSEARIRGKHWMVFGRATRSVDLHDPSGSLLGACFLNEGAPHGSVASVLCAIALPTQPTSPPSYSLQMDPALYGLTSPVELTDLWTGRSLGSFVGNVTHSASVAPLDVQLLMLTSTNTSGVS